MKSSGLEYMTSNNNTTPHNVKNTLQYMMTTTNTGSKQNKHLTAQAFPQPAHRSADQETWRSTSCRQTSWRRNTQA